MSGIVASWRTAGGIAAVVLFSAGVPLAESVSSATSAVGREIVARPVVDRNVREAVEALRARFRLDSPEGLGALRELSLGVLREGLKDEDPYERCYAASALAEQGDWSGVGVLETGVASSDAGLRRAAIEGLGEIGRGDALRILRRVYAESDPFDQLLVLQGLRSGGGAEAFDLLIEAVG